MVINNPAQPSTANLATTQDESRGGFFTETAGVGIDLQGITGNTGDQGVGIASITATRDDNTGIVTVTYLLSDGSSQVVTYTVTDGQMGTPGTTIRSGEVDPSGSLILTLTDDTQVTVVGNVVGPQGVPGEAEAIQSITVNSCLLYTSPSPRDS